MMNEKTNTSEQFRRELEAKLRRTRQEAPESSVFDERDRQENEVFEGFLSGRLSLKEYHKQDPRGETLYPNEVEVATIESLREALGILVRAEVADELVAHEADHYQVAIEAGFSDTRILIRFYEEGGQVGFRPGVFIILPKQGNEQEIREKLRAIIEAPDELSDLDRAQLGRS